MTQQERDFIIHYLALTRGWNKKTFEKMSDKDLERYYQEAWERP